MLKDGGLIMVAKNWKSWMLGTLLGVGGWISIGDTSLADPPRGYTNHRGVIVPNQNYQYRYNYSYRYGYNPSLAYHPHYHCQPIYGVPNYGVPIHRVPQYGSYYGNYYTQPAPGIGIVIGGWPSGPSFGGGGFPSGPSFGGGTTFRIGR